MPSADIATALKNIVLITFVDKNLLKPHSSKIAYFGGYSSITKTINQAKFHSYIINLARS